MMLSYRDRLRVQSPLAGGSGRDGESTEMQPNTNGPARSRVGTGLAWSLGALLAWGAVVAGEADHGR